MSFRKLVTTTKQLNRNQLKTREEILALQESAFREMLVHAYNHSPFYRDYYRKHGIRESHLPSIPKEEIPVLDKDTYLREFDRLVTDSDIRRKDLEALTQQTQNRDQKYLGRYTVVHSSGSTGKPTPFLYDPEAWTTVIAAAFRACRGEITFRKALPRLARRLRVLYIAATEGRFGGRMLAASGISGFGFRRLLLNVNQPMTEWVTAIEKFQPDVVIGYPSSLKMLSDLALQDRVRMNAFRVVTGGEPLSRDQREYIQTALGTEVFNLYAASESLVLGLERAQSEGFYLYDDLNLVEIKEDHTLVTPLYNRTQPLIRYRMTDRLRPAARREGETLPFSKASEVLGRSEELMWFLNAEGQWEFLHPLVIYAFDVPHIVRYQFVQRSSERFEIHVEMKPDTSFLPAYEALRRQVEEVLREKRLQRIQYEIRQVEQIPVDPQTGKSRIVVKS